MCHFLPGTLPRLGPCIAWWHLLDAGQALSPPSYICVAFRCLIWVAASTPCISRDPHLPGQDVPWAHLFIWPDVFDDNNGGDIPSAHNTQEAAKKEKFDFLLPRLSHPLSNPMLRRTHPCSRDSGETSGRVTCHREEAASILARGHVLAQRPHSGTGLQCTIQAQPEQPRCGKGLQLASRWAWCLRTKRFWGKGGECRDWGANI